MFLLLIIIIIIVIVVVVVIIIIIIRRHLGVFTQTAEHVLPGRMDAEKSVCTYLS